MVEYRLMRTLLVGYVASDLSVRGKHGELSPSPSLTEGDVTCHTLDIYHRHAIEKTVHAKAVCSAHLPEGPWDLIRFRTGPKIHSGELSLDLLQEISRLAPNAKLLGGNGSGPQVELDYVGREGDRNDFLDKIRKDRGRVRDFAAKWTSSVPGIAPVEFTSFPGCFCHRRPDDGGLALAEVVSREMSDGEPGTKANDEISVLDMGCGCGLVGLLIAAAIRGKSDARTSAESGARAPGRPLRLVAVDSHSRAVEATELNAKNLGVRAEVILSDNGTPARMDGTFDVFVGNPPYYSDYRIADVFLETARRALRPGGVCYTVCKNAAGLEPVQKRYFPAVEIIRRRGYAVLKSLNA